MRKILFISLALLMGLAACTDKKEKIATHRLQAINLGVMSSMDYIPFAIANQEGIYDSLGLKVNIMKFLSANEQDAAFQSEKVDGTVTGFTNAILQQVHGIPLKIIMKNDGYFCFITRKESGIKSLKQLNGKIIAVSHNTAIEYCTDYILNKAGIAVEEVNKPAINNIIIRLEMLQNKQIDASIFPDPFASIAMSNGCRSLISTQELGLSVTGTIFSEKALKEKSEEIKQLIIGYNLAVNYMYSHPDKEWKQVLTTDAEVPEALANIIALPQYHQATLPASKDLENTILWLKAKGLVPASYNQKNIIDSTYTRPEIMTNAN
ncbi:MetQ/NlpA family ABC transporter substrate-binding protein [uncultured Bacteroides sp.]|uniref:ABC transporter substrate-binding protein n=1 Tax=uncultured Bacteroides sp. TaxID=162156 RepID=UPI002AA71E63|nr:MetQ/NlpA family ABC transporter substrate-binding protein [uncultured Bacteroides sp.]